MHSVLYDTDHDEIYGTFLLSLIYLDISWYTATLMHVPAESIIPQKVS